MAIASGALLAFGALFPLSALTAGVLVSAGKPAIDLSHAVPATGGTAALVFSLLVAYFWGGYTAGRMGRGAGLANGLLVPAGTILFVGGVIGAASAFGGHAAFNLPFSADRLPIDTALLRNLGAGLAVLSALCMLTAGIVGGILGSGWHSKIERVAGLAAPAVEQRRPEPRRSYGDRFEGRRSAREWPDDGRSGRARRSRIA
ncbi:MAG: hypothetical protein HY775_08055 [Acidobacteria bacterium]|nr:hypothetical protein [Acidobacteriota bacterium]